MNVKLILISGCIIFTMNGCSMLDSPAPVPKQFKQQQNILAAHNQYRAYHQAPALIWDQKLVSYAARYASHCRFQHSHGPYGENLAAGTLPLSAAVQYWYDELAHYSYARPGFSKTTGHFTQLVWRSTTRLGCAYAVCNGKNGTPGRFLVCEYSPPGNVIGESYFRNNVLPPK